jgi:hypothetical protein
MDEIHENNDMVSVESFLNPYGNIIQDCYELLLLKHNELDTMTTRAIFNSAKKNYD